MSDRACWAAVGVGLATIVLCWQPAGARGYAEDVCPALDGTGWGRCSAQLEIGEACTPGGSLDACAAILMLSEGATGASRLLLQAVSEGARSTVHTDTTYFLAQAAGFTPKQAYWIAAYDEVVDVGRYEHADEDGKLMADPDECTTSSRPIGCRLLPEEIPGVNRNNFEGGGLFLHFMAPLDADAPAPAGDDSIVLQSDTDTGAPPAGTEGLRPSRRPDPFTETVLANARRWALDRAPLCVAGLTVPSRRGDLARGAQCYRSSVRAQATINGRLPFVTELGSPSDLNWTTPLGELELTEPGATEPVPASRIASLVGKRRAPLARVGIYLHTIQDRISHQICNDGSYVAGPRPADAPLIALNPLANDAYQLFTGNYGVILRQDVVTDPEFQIFYSREECDQQNHSARHELETGREQGTLSADDRTTEPGMRVTLRELRRFATARRVGRALSPHPRAPSRVRGRTLRRRLLAALEVRDPGERLEALTAAGRSVCLLPLPGYGGLDAKRWLRRADRRRGGCNRRG